MRLGVVCAGFALVATSGIATAATRDIQTSWGKPGVSFAEYRTDANICAAGAMQIDISGTDAAQRAVDASRKLDTLYGMGSNWGFSVWPGGGFIGGGPNVNAIEHLRNSYRVKDTLAEIKDWQLQVLHGCLRGLGYRQFVLTPDQRAALKRLPLRSDRRHGFLYSLASNPMVLSRQAI